jgi:protein-S-isoprenylcysteine O-methyltransferase Ste14
MAILGLVFLNLPAWFHEPFSLLQIISWVILAGSLVLVIDGTRRLRQEGVRDDRIREEGHLLGMERTTELIRTGAYRYVRHPMYGSLLLLAWGALLKEPSWTGTALVVAATGFLLATAIAEETENIRYFGEPYRTYMRETKRFIPFLF